jgi:hypothetical protein
MPRLPIRAIIEDSMLKRLNREQLDVLTGSVEYVVVCNGLVYWTLRNMDEGLLLGNLVHQED